MENMTYLLAAYGSVWIVFFFFLMRLLRREKKLSKQVDILRLKLEEGHQDASEKDISTSG